MIDERELVSRHFLTEFVNMTDKETFQNVSSQMLKKIMILKLKYICIRTVKKNKRKKTTVLFICISICLPSFSLNRKLNFGFMVADYPLSIYYNQIKVCFFILETCQFCFL